MKVINNLNNFLKENQALLNFLGFIAVIITILLTYYQVDISNTQYENESIPNFSVSILNNDQDIFSDSLSFNNLNNNHNLLTVTLYTLNANKLVEFESYHMNYDTRRLKNLIRNLANDMIVDYDYSIGDIALLKHKSDVYSIPIIFEFSYLEKNQLKNFHLLYQYDYVVYFGNDTWQIRTKGLDYKKSIIISNENRKDIIKDFLIQYSLEKHIEISKAVKYLLILEILKKDNQYQPIYSLYKLNDSLARVQQKITIVDEKDTISFEVKYFTPEFVENDTLNLQRKLLLNRILNNKSNYSKEFKKHLVHMEDSVKILKKFRFNYFNRNLEVKYEPLPYWKNLNDSLLIIAYKDYSKH